MIAIINYGSGNVAAIANIYKLMKVHHAVVSDHRALQAADKYVLPGVGHFDHTMATVRQAGIHETLQENVLVKGKPLLGICVGMQVLAESSEEGTLSGFGWIPGRVKRITAATATVRLPHMGWNAVTVRHDPIGLFQGVDVALGFYFLHSYCFDAPAGNVMASTEYGGTLTCGVTNGRNVFGVQFHPEKSHRNGVAIFHNFAKA